MSRVSMCYEREGTCAAPVGADTLLTTFARYSRKSRPAIRYTHLPPSRMTLCLRPAFLVCVTSRWPTSYHTD